MTIDQRAKQGEKSQKSLIHSWKQWSKQLNNTEEFLVQRLAMRTKSLVIRSS